MTTDDEKQKLSRRRFIQHGSRLGAGVAVAPLVLKLSACGSDDPASAPDASMAGDGDGDNAPETSETMGETIAAGAVLLGLYPGDGAEAMTQAASRLDSSWLKEGDSVLIKVASNSPNPHPATTSPAGVRGMVQALKARGAGRVIVADQAGVEWVRNTATGRFSSTREMFEGNGLAALEDEAELHFFDDGDWDTGYVQATLPDENRWPRGMWIASIIKEVDHIVYMPRISAHLLAGLTHAQKSAIGWLRDDSRNDLHKDAGEFYEKYAEVNYVEEIQSRFRMAVTVSEKVQLFGGPDEGVEYEMDPPLVLASTSMANHDAMAASLLISLQDSSGAAPAGMVYRPAIAATANAAFANGVLVGGTGGEAGPWLSDAPESRYQAHSFEQGVGSERAVARGWALSGGKPSTVDVVVDGEPLDGQVQEGVEAHGEGLYNFA